MRRLVWKPDRVTIDGTVVEIRFARIEGYYIVQVVDDNGEPVERCLKASYDYEIAIREALFRAGLLVA